MKIFRGLNRRQDGNRVRPQMGIDRIAHDIGSGRLFDIDMRDLTQRVHAGIGAAGALYNNCFTTKAVNRLFEFLLD
jgi:hypothetical protein